MVTGVIFDMDGLMFDTEPLWKACWAPALALFGLGELPGLADAARGVAAPQTVPIIARFYGPDVDAAGIRREFDRLAAECFARGVPPKPGLDGLLAYLEERGVPRAVASSSPRAMVEGNLAHAGLTDRFGAVVAGGEVARSKPDPDIFLEAARRLGCDPATTLVLEDSFAGVRAGAAGGFVTVMVPDLMQPTDEIRALCRAVCSDLGEVCGLLRAGEL